MAFLGQAYFRAKYFAATLLHGAAAVAAAAISGGGGGKKHRRKRVLKRTVHGAVISVWQEEFKESPPVAISEKLTDEAFEVIQEREIDSDFEIRSLIARLMVKVIQEDEEDEELALFAAL